MPKLDLVPEGRKSPMGTPTESKKPRVKTYAKLFSISRQALINDDLNAFADTPQASAGGC